MREARPIKHTRKLWKWFQTESRRRSHRGRSRLSLDRRQFLANSAKAAAAAKLLPQFLSSAQQQTQSEASASQKPYGSGYFGTWIEDEFGLPAFHYTCDQLHDPKAKTEVN